MAVERIKWNIAGFRQLRRSREVTSDLIQRGQRIASSAGPGYEYSPFTGRNRARVSVLAASAAAKSDNARNNSLVRAIDAGR